MASPANLTGKLVPVSRYHFACGLHCDLWQAFDESGQVVVVKAVRTSWNSPEQLCKMKRRILREISILSALKRHPNIVPFLGVTYGFGRAEIPAPVCLFYKDGDIVEYLKRIPVPICDRFKLISQVAAGLSYLHRNGIVHGDIKGVNILMSEGGAALCDFGLSRILDVKGFTTQTVGGTCRWMAPELLECDKAEELPRVTTFSDIWAFAMTVLEIITGRPPFLDKWGDATVLLTVINGGRPNHRDYAEIDHETWGILGLCWHRNPEERLNMKMLSLFFDLAASTTCPKQAKRIWDEAADALSSQPIEQDKHGTCSRDAYYLCQWPHCQEFFTDLEHCQEHEVSHAKPTPPRTPRWPKPHDLVKM
ncbi:kinase-like protein [Neolentinus lepideus HHB14362 ss-1]|uniref:Kinase-like protein n=1 Tax=Neolentinus lepideus HHB14362 ss-1 TaxID=1314782 RepID=A0A165PIF9_9AGAM|nr:kinase-like protein [Neolentinus lepideus HHB14362 ss-1]